MKKRTGAGFFLLCIMAAMSCIETPKNNNIVIDTKTDTSEITGQTGFAKTLELQGFKFDVSTSGEGSLQQLSIQPHGLKIDSAKLNMEIDGSVANAEIGDLDADGYPELLIYTVSAGSGSYGNVIGYSVHEGNKLLAIDFPAIADSAGANKGYMGHDEFAIEKSALVRRFKTYHAGDSNSNPTGKTRQIQYMLKKGNGSPKFVVDKVLEY